LIVVFIIDNITKSEKYEIKGIWKAEENKILTIKIINKLTRQNITFCDSMSFVNNDSLRKSINIL